MDEAKALLRNAAPGLALFGVALGVRVLAGLLFFGSVDMVNTLMNADRALAPNAFFYHLPAFPVLPLFFRAGAAMAVLTPLPLTFCFKFFPIVFDAWLAVLVFRAREAGGHAGAWRAGLLYALCPVAVLITCFHAQWDAICLFFLLGAFLARARLPRGRTGEALFGALFVASILVKPFPLMLLPAFLPPLAEARRDGWKAYLARAAWCCGAAAVTGGLAALVFMGAGYDLGRLLGSIFVYSSKGVQIFGLPFAPGFSALVFLQHRLWVLFALLALSAPYHAGRLAGVDYVAAAFLLVLGVSGLGPQYLLWPVPFLLAAARGRLPMVYPLVASLFLVAYYLCPMASYFPRENLNVFVPLAGAAWLAPPTSWLASGLLPMVRFVGNLVLPALCLTLGAFLVKAGPGPAPKEGSSLRAFLGETAPALPVFLMAVALLLLLSWDAVYPGTAFREAVFEKVPRYAFQAFRDGHLFFAPAPRAAGWAAWCNGASLVALWAAGWFLLALRRDGAR